MAKAKKYGGFTPKEIMDQIAALFPGTTDQWISQFFKFLVEVAGPIAIKILMARKPAKMAVEAAGEDLDDAIRSIETDFAQALGPQPDVEPGKVGGPGVEMILTRAFTSLLDLAERSVPAAVKTIGGILDKYSPIALP